MNRQELLTTVEMMGRGQTPFSSSGRDTLRQLIGVLRSHANLWAPNELQIIERAHRRYWPTRRFDRVPGTFDRLIAMLRTEAGASSQKASASRAG